MNTNAETRFTLRIETALFEKVKELAKKNKRSAAKQIEFIIEDWLSQNNPKEQTKTNP